MKLLMPLKTIVLILSLLLGSVVFGDEGLSTTTTTNTSKSVSNDSAAAPGETTVTRTTTTSTTIVNDTDEKIVSAIYARYGKDQALIGTQLKVGSLNGVVTVSGSVTMQAQADEAVAVAKSIDGVRDVKSSIEVTTNTNNINNPNNPNDGTPKTSNY